MHIKSTPPSSPSSKTAQKDPQSYYLILWYCAHVQASLKTTIFLQIFSNLEVNHLKNSLWIVGFAGQLLVVVSQLVSSTGDQYQVIPTSPIKNCIRDIRRETRIFSVFHENFPHLLAVAIFIIFMLKKRPTNRPSIHPSNRQGQSARRSGQTVQPFVRHFVVRK